MSSGVEFDEDSFSYGKPKPNLGSMAGGGYTPPNFPNSGNRGFSGWLQSHGIVKSEHGAQVVMIAIVIINIIITYVAVKYFL